MKIRRTTDQITIQPKIQARVKWLIGFSLILLLLASVYSAYLIGVKKGHEEFDLDQAIKQSLSLKNQQLQKKVENLDRQKTLVQRQHQVQKEAYKELNKAYANSEERNKALLSKIHFLRGVVAPSNEELGASIQQVDVRLLSNQLEFDIGLVQSLKNDAWVRGKLMVTLYQNGQEIHQWPQNAMKVINYQYFQEITGSMPVQSISQKSKLKIELVLADGKTLQKWHDLSYLLNKDKTTTGE